MTPEAASRLKIDERLMQAGWVIQNVKQLNLPGSYKKNGSLQSQQGNYKQVILVRFYLWG